MSIKRPIAPIQLLKFRGIFDFPGVLQTIYNWGNQQGFEVHEKKFKHKVPDVRGAEQEVVLLGWRKVDAYVKFWFSADIKAKQLKDVDVIVEGKKKRLTQGKMRLNFTGYVELDYNNRFEDSAFLVGLRDFYHKFIIRPKIQNIWEDVLYYRLYKCNKLVKEKLEMENLHYSSEGRW